MGLTDWFSRPKCGDCGTKIDGPKFSRTAMGTTFWVCAPCQETYKARQDEERQRILAAQKERQRAHDQKPQLEPAQSVSSRSDEDIAETLGLILRHNCATIYKDWTAVADTGVVLDSLGTFSFVLSIVAIAFRKWGVPGIDDGRFDRIEETLVRYAYGAFVNTPISNPPLPSDIQPANRQATLAKLIGAHRQIAQVHKDNLVKALKSQEALTDWILLVTMKVVMQKETAAKLFSDKEKLARLTQSVGKVITNILTSDKVFEKALGAVPIPTNAEIAIELPKSWILRGSAPYVYYDPATLQYNLQITVSKPGAVQEAPEQFLKKLLPKSSSPVQPISLSESRVMATYRTDTPEMGAAKDDYHWIVVDKESGAGRYALFTLSVLAASADSQVTAALSATLGEAIGHASFLG